MKKLILLGMLLVMVAVAAFLNSCNSSGPQNVTGDPNDPNFVFVESFVGEQALGNVERILDISYMFVDSIPGSTLSPKSSTGRQAMSDSYYVVDSFNYAYTNGWHEFAFWLKVLDSASTDTVVVTGMDSLRALNNGTPMQVPDTSVDELNVRCHFTYDLTSGTFNGSADYSMDLTGISTDTSAAITINASGSESLVGSAVDSQVTCDFDLSNSLAANDVVFLYNGDGCPTSGSINLTANIDIYCTGQISTSADTVAIQGEWGIGAVFANDMIDLTYTDGNTIWQASQPCSGPSASPMAKWKPNME